MDAQGTSGIPVPRREIEALKLAYSCLLEVRRDFGAPINNVIAEVREVLSAAAAVRQDPDGGREVLERLAQKWARAVDKDELFGSAQDLMMLETSCRKAWYALGKPAVEAASVPLVTETEER